MKPGDIVTTMSGKTVEVQNTDAEGRLILADGLAYATRYKPAAIIDIATLTGACVVALGSEAIGSLTKDARIAARLNRAGKVTHARVWRLPLWPAYEGDIEPDIANLDNAPKGGFAGSITAALFLKRFAGEGPWVHFDIYGWVPKARPGRPKGGECQAARAVLAVLETRYGRAR